MKCTFRHLPGAFLFVLMLGVASSASASTFFFPDMKPAMVQAEPPAWLKEGASGDGYVTVTSEVIPIGSCARLSSSSFWHSEKEQLVLSVNSGGFKSRLDGVDVPIATFDGRENMAACASLSTAPQQIVPLAVLGARSLLNPGKLTLVLNVKSSSDGQSDYVGSAKLLLGAATLVATGGSSAVIGGATAIAGNSVLSDTESKANKLMKGMTDAKTPIALSWGDLRKGLRSVDIPVYKTEQSLGSDADKKIQQLQTDPKADKIQLFTVHLDFSYARTLFYPSAEEIAHLGDRENISAERILNHLVPGSKQNFMQLLNDAAPSPLRILGNAEGADLTRSCSIGFEKLRGAGLANPDIAIVMKSFIDEAKGSDTWYGDTAFVHACFDQAPKVAGYLNMIYGPPSPQKQSSK